MQKGTTNTLLIACAVAAAAASQVVKIDDYDLFWHIRTGQLIWEQRRIPTLDPYSFTAAGPWHYTEALAQLYFYGLHHLGGPIAIQVGQILLVGGLAWMVARLAFKGCSSDGLGAALATTACLMASHFRLGAKSEIFSFVCFAATLLTLRVTEERRSAANLAWLPLLFFFWGYLHRGGTLGLVAVAVWSGAWALKASTRKLAGRSFVTLAACVVALSLNPAGAGYLGQAFDLTIRQSFKLTLPEWGPIPWSFLITPVGIPFSLLVLAWGCDVGKQWRVSPDALLGAVTLALAFCAIRFIPFAAIAMVPGVAHAFAEATDRMRPGGRYGYVVTSAAGATAMLVSVAAVYMFMLPPGYAGFGLLPGRYPLDAARFVRRTNPPGRMWNPFDFGGYLIYALWPGARVFIDGRNDTVYSNAFYLQSFIAERSPAALARTLDLYDISYAVVRAADVSMWSQVKGVWVPVHTDPVATVLVRETSQTRAYLDAYDRGRIRSASNGHP